MYLRKMGKHFIRQQHIASNAATDESVGGFFSVVSIGGTR